MQMLDLSLRSGATVVSDVSCRVETTIQITHDLGIYRLLGADWSGIVVMTKTGKIHIEDEYYDYGAIGLDGIYEMLEKYRDSIFGLGESLLINNGYGVMVLPIRKTPHYEVFSVIYRQSPFDEEALEWMSAYCTVYYENVLLKNDLSQITDVMENIFDNTEIAILNIDMDGNLVAANLAATQLFKLGDDFTKKNIRQLGAVGSLWDNARSIARGGTKYSVQEYPMINREETRFLNIVFSPITSSKDEVLSVVMTCSDETEKLLMEREIEQMNQFALLGEVAVGIAHDVRNPLMNIRCSARLLEKNNVANHAVIREFLDDVVHEVDRINDVVEQMLNYGNIGKRGPYLLVDINEIIRQSIAVMQRSLGGKSIDLRMCLNETLPIIPGSKTEIQQALLNILLNAVQAIPEKGTVVISSDYVAGKDKINISVRDTGTGVSKEIQGKLLNHFFSTKPNGVGFGLSIVKRVVANHGGELFFDSEPGKGTLISIHLPCQMENKE